MYLQISIRTEDTGDGGGERQRAPVILLLPPTPPPHHFLEQIIFSKLNWKTQNF